jgi:transmembrane sensor
MARDAEARRAQIGEESALWLEKIERAITKDETQALRRWLKTRAHREIIVDRCKRWHGPEILAVLGELIPAEAYAEERTERRYDRILIAIVFGVSALALTTVLVAMTRVWSRSGPQHALARSESLFQTGVAQRKSIKLPDGSVILMNELARLQVSFSPHGRDVSLLRGEASFDVREDSKRPFIVYAGARQFNVLGGAASFDIARETPENSQLTVVSGEVDVPEARASTPLSAALVREHVNSGAHRFSAGEIGSLGPGWFSAAKVSPEVSEHRLAWQRDLAMTCGFVDGTVGAYYVCDTHK